MHAKAWLVVLIQIGASQALDVYILKKNQAGKDGKKLIYLFAALMLR